MTASVMAESPMRRTMLVLAESGLCAWGCAMRRDRGVYRMAVLEDVVAWLCEQVHRIDYAVHDACDQERVEFGDAVWTFSGIIHGHLCVMTSVTAAMT